MPVFAPVKAFFLRRPNGEIDLHSGYALAESADLVVHKLMHWGQYAQDRIFLQQRTMGQWQRITYGDVMQLSARVATGLIGIGCSAERPLMVLAGNSVEHAVFMLAAMRVGIPVAPVSAAYAGYGNYDRLRQLVATSGAHAVLVGPEIAEPARRALAEAGLIVLMPGSLADTEPDADGIGRAEANLTPDTIAKLMFTSGSTGSPKAVINTHRMLAANQQQLGMVWATDPQAPPVFVDWLPWSHTFGGNFVFNMALWTGGTLCIDDGRPAPALIRTTLEAMATHRPTHYFSVPAGYEALLPALDADPNLARQALSRLEFAFCAAAALPETTFDRLAEVLHRYGGRPIPIVAGWGSTETAPCSTVVHFANSDPANIGVPLPGTTIKLVPADDRLEVRVKGPNVTPGYWRDAAATAAAFDEEGFYRIGDAARLIDPDRPGAGLAFDGRIAENFKLASGTWVNVGALRLAVIDATRPYVQDAVIAGHDRDRIGVLLFLNEPACRAAFGVDAETGMAGCGPLHKALRDCLARHNQAAGGSSMTISLFRIESRPPSIADGEITDKGYINQRAVLSARSSSANDMFTNERIKV